MSFVIVIISFALGLSEVTGSSFEGWLSRVRGGECHSQKDRLAESPNIDDCEIVGQNILKGKYPK